LVCDGHWGDVSLAKAHFLDGALSFVAEIFAVLFFPGLFFGLLVNRNFHDPNMIAAALANAILYGLIFKAGFKIFSR